MKTEFDPKELREDVLREGADFREALLNKTLVAVRRRSRATKIRLGAVAVLMMGAAFLLLQHKPQRSIPAIAEKVSEHSYQLVQSRPLPANEVIETKPFAEIITANSPSSVKIVFTASSRLQINRINDDQLLSLVSAHPAILVRVNAGLEQLVFADPQDEKNFLTHY